MRVFVTGIGIITSVGNDATETIANIRKGHSGIAAIERLETVHKAEIPLAEVRLNNEQLAAMAGLKSARNISRTTLLGLIAAQQAIRQAGIANLGDAKTGLVSATSVGGMDRTEDFYVEFLKNGSLDDVSVLLTHECGESTERIADVLGVKGLVTTVSTACSSSANSIMTGARLIKHGLLNRCIAGGTDALARFTLNGFDTLKILDHAFCQPFDGERRGLNLGEGAGFLVLESEKTAAPERILAEVVGYANTNDAYHQTASSPEGQGAFLAMQKALELAGLQPSDIDYINAHGTGTQNNDLSEGRAMQKLFGQQVPPFSSTKAFTGHTLGAAGGVEAVLSILAIQHGIIYPNLRWQNAIEELYIRPATQLIENADIRCVLSNSFGFGGNSSALVFKR